MQKQEKRREGRVLQEGGRASASMGVKGRVERVKVTETENGPRKNTGLSTLTGSLWRRLCWGVI